MFTTKKYRATATITLPIVAVFDNDGLHPLDTQADAALQAEAQAFYCLADSDPELQDIQIEPLSISMKPVNSSSNSAATMGA